MRQPPLAAVAVLLAGVLLGAPAAAQTAAPAAPERAPTARQGLAELAYVLGQSHGLAQRCRRDNYRWYERMQRLLTLEAPDPAFRRQLIGTFNDGYQAARLRHPACEPATRRALAAATRRGRDIAGVIAAAR